MIIFHLYRFAIIISSLTRLCHSNSTTFSCPEILELCPKPFGDCQRLSTYGWKLYCLHNQNNGNLNYDILINYISNFSLTINCNGNQLYNYSQSYFEKITQFNGTKILNFKKCPIPDTDSFAKTLHSMELNRFSFVGTREEYFHSIKTFLKDHSSLLSLKLESIDLSKMDPSLLEYSRELENLSFENTSLRNLPANLFRNNSKITSLSLAGNKLKKLPPGIFGNIEKLKKLCLNGNNLVALQLAAFGIVDELESIEISLNEMTVLPIGIMHRLVGLIELDVSFNEIELLAYDTFAENYELEHLILASNRLRYLDENVFRNLHKLKMLELSYNNLMEIPRKLLVKNPMLKNLMLNENGINFIAQYAFENQGLLEILQLSRNSIEVLEKNCFVGLSSLKILDLSMNLIKYVPAGLFTHLQAIETLDMSHNRIKSLPPDFFANNFENLHNLYLRNVSLENIPDVYRLKNIRRVLLSDNLIRNFTFRKTAYSSVEIHLEGNDISLIEVLDSEEEAPRSITPTYHIKAKNLRCDDCRLFKFIEFFKNKSKSELLKHLFSSDKSHLKCGHPPELKGIHLQSMNSNRFRCSRSEDCPTYCQCFNRPSLLAVEVICSAILAIPENLPENTTELAIDGSYLANDDLARLNNSTYKNLKILRITNNINITSISFLPKALELLDLRNNSITIFPKYLEDYKDRNTGLRLFLGGNPFACNCSMLEFKNFLIKNIFSIKDLQSIHCVFPSSSNKTYISKVLDEELCPNEEVGNYKYGLLISILVPLGVIVIFVLVLIILKDTLILILFSINNDWFYYDDIERKLTYDATVFCHRNDADFIRKLISNLEVKGKTKFKLFIYKRGADFGVSISQRIFDVIERSRRVIFVVSFEFLNSSWALYAFKLVHHRVIEENLNRCIIIQVGDYDVESIENNHIKFFVSSNSCLRQNEFLFWTKLRYRMPRSPNPRCRNISYSNV